MRFCRQRELSGRGQEESLRLCGRCFRLLQEQRTWEPPYLNVGCGKVALDSTRKGKRRCLAPKSKLPPTGSEQSRSAMPGVEMTTRLNPKENVAGGCEWQSKVAARVRESVL